MGRTSARHSTVLPPTVRAASAMASHVGQRCYRGDPVVTVGFLVSAGRVVGGALPDPIRVAFLGGHGSFSNPFLQVRVFYIPPWGIYRPYTPMAFVVKHFKHLCVGSSREG